MKQIFTLCLAGFVLASCARTTPTPASAEETDGWVSSGGEIFEDRQNPWWIQNTKEVSYCIQVDEKSFSASPEQVERGFRDALEYWRSEIAKAAAVHPEKTLGVHVATQVFNQIECASSPDLRILAGEGALSAKEARFLGEVERMAAHSVRTSYDRVELKGKGFLFLASDLGKRRLRQDASAAPWRKRVVLKYVIAHELGHIFGFPHVGEEGLMSEGFLNENFIHAYRDAWPTRIESMAMEEPEGHIPFLVPHHQFSHLCTTVRSFAETLTSCEKFFGVSHPNQSYIHFSLRPYQREMKVKHSGMEISAGKSIRKGRNRFYPDPVPQWVGSLLVRRSAVKPKVAIKTFLTNAQRVFSAGEPLNGIAQLSFEWSGTYVPRATQESKAIFIRRDAESHTILAEVDGMLDELIHW